jgi:hypothetical protein
MSDVELTDTGLTATHDQIYYGKDRKTKRQ